MIINNLDINVPDTLYEIYQTKNNSQLPLNDINIFVGPNNSGKSLFIRSLFNCFPKISLESLEKMIEILPYKPSPHLNKPRPAGINIKDYINAINNLELNLNANNISSLIIRINQLIKTLTTKEGYSSEIEDLEYVCNYLDEVINALDSKFYIPILRGLRRLYEDQGENEVKVYKDYYQSRTFKDYFPIGNMREQNNTSLKKQDFSTYEKLEEKIFTGLNLYEKFVDLLLGYPEDRELITTFEKELSNRFFSGSPVTIIPHRQDESIHIKIGNEKQFPIHKLGDGLQNLIICTFLVITTPDPNFFFIEEPELYMHPGMQRAFMELLCNYNQHQYFLTTHSNHLLTIASETDKVNIFSFIKQVKEGEPEINISVRTPTDNSILRSLGVSNSSVFLANCTIWVEGITDKLYIRTYLKKYIEDKHVGRSFQEDLHYAFIEYQGSCITHWNFDNESSDGNSISAKKVCGNPFVIADGDIATKGDREKILREHLVESFFMLKCKEIENIIPEEVLKSHPKIPEEIRTQIKFNEYYDTSETKLPLGTYLQDKSDQLRLNKSFKEESGTIKAKKNFCVNAIDWMNTNWESWALNEPIKELCQKIIEHIEINNP